MGETAPEGGSSRRDERRENRQERQDARQEQKEERKAEGDVRRADNALDATERKLFNTGESLEDADSETNRAKRLKEKQANLEREKTADEEELRLAQLRVDLLQRDVDISEEDFLRLENEFRFTFTKDSLADKSGHTLYFPRPSSPLRFVLVPPDSQSPALEVHFERSGFPAKAQMKLDKFSFFIDQNTEVFPSTPPETTTDGVNAAAPASSGSEKAELKSEATARVINELLRTLGEGKASGMDGAFQTVQLVMLRLQIAMNGDSFKLWAENGKTGPEELDEGHLAVLAARGIMVTRSGTTGSVEFKTPDESQPAAPSISTIASLKETLRVADEMGKLTGIGNSNDFPRWYGLYQSFFTQTTEASQAPVEVRFKDYLNATAAGVKTIQEKITPPTAEPAKPAPAPAKPAPATPAPSENPETPPKLTLNGTEPSAVLLVLALQKVYGKDVNPESSMVDLVRRNPKRLQAALTEVMDAYKAAQSKPAASAAPAAAASTSASQ